MAFCEVGDENRRSRGLEYSLRGSVGETNTRCRAAAVLNRHFVARIFNWVQLVLCLMVREMCKARVRHIQALRMCQDIGTCLSQTSCDIQPTSDNNKCTDVLLTITKKCHYHDTPYLQPFDPQIHAPLRRPSLPPHLLLHQISSHLPCLHRIHLQY